MRINKKESKKNKRLRTQCMRTARLTVALLLVSQCAMAAASHRLGNSNLNVQIAENGGLVSVENLLAEESYSLSSDLFVVATDLGEFSNRDVKPAIVKADAREIAFRC